jgi:hypothetical protein
MLFAAASSAAGNLASLSSTGMDSTAAAAAAAVPVVVHTTKRLLPQPQPLKWVLRGTLTAVVMAVFSQYFPFLSDPTFGVVAPQIYQPAWFAYNPLTSLFDNTALTFGSDYMIALVMVLWAFAIKLHPSAHLGISRQESSLLYAHGLRSRGLLLTYALSTLSGGIAHQWFVSVDQRNTWAFRLLWTVCVGSVTAAAGWMGSIATVWAVHDEQRRCSVCPLWPGTFWVAYAVFGTAVVAAGGLSYQRPACDIFVAGITQTPSSFYVMGLLYKGLPTLNGLSKPFRMMGMVAFILNAPLLPIYPLLISKTNLTVGQVNGVLHIWLTFAWSSQGFVLWMVSKSLEREITPPELAVPIKQKAC